MVVLAIGYALPFAIKGHGGLPWQQLGLGLAVAQSRREALWMIAVAVGDLPLYVDYDSARIGPILRGLVLFPSHFSFLRPLFRELSLPPLLLTHVLPLQLLLRYRSPGVNVSWARAAARGGGGPSLCRGTCLPDCHPVRS